MHMEVKGLLTFPVLREITNNFSKERKLGQGPHGVVYRGVTANGEAIAVKLLYVDKPGLDDKRFRNEFNNLRIMLKHPNLVGFIDYCYETQQIPADYNGRTVPVEKTLRALCFEYLHQGSLKMYLSDELTQLDWHMSYKIIKGTCEGLKFIHEGLKESIYHLELNLDNILLDKDMVPKLTDFGFYKIFGEDLTNIRARSHGTLKNYPSEFITTPGDIDVFSLGVVMMNIMTAPMGLGHNKPFAGTLHDFLDLAQENWKKWLQKTWSGSSLKVYCQQVKCCAEIALDCMENRYKRPNMLHILNRLNEMEGLVDLIVNPPYKVVRQRSPELYVLENSTSRMDDIYNGLRVLEHTVEGSEKPSNLKLPLLKHITNNFSDDLKIGHGGCGVIYKGILPNGTVAVKKLFNSHTIDDEMFHREVKSMIVVHHQNIVRFLGYCSHTEEQAVEMAGIINMAQIRERLLCFEYISNGSLENHITDELRGLEWHTRYQIINGICEGLQHLHKEKHIIHMDLKPANILLDDHFVPKITDFGLSRLDEKSQTMSKERLISLGYCSPEYHYHGKMSAKSDIYSLGVIIIELLTGSKETPSITKVMVLRRWSHRWNKSMKHTPLWYQQVTRCLNLALRCKHTDPIERPYIWDIICDLNKMDSIDVPACGQMIPCLEDMLGVEPLDIHLSFEVNKELSCSIELINNTDDYIAFRISMISLRQYHIHPSKDIVPPRSKCSATIALQPQERAPPHSYCRDEFCVQSTRVDGSLTAMDITGDTFNEEPGKLVDNMNFMVVLDVPP